MSDLSDALLAGMRAAPQLDPSHLYGIAQSSSIDDVPDNATATSAFGNMTKRKSYLEAQDPNVQASAWASAGDAERQMLTEAGYTPPALAKHSTGPFAAVGHFLGDVANLALVKPAEELGHGVTEALHYAGAPLRQLQHAYRSAALLTDESVGRRVGIVDPAALGESFGAIFSPSGWAKAWRESEHGEQTFSPVALRQLQERYDPSTLDLAKQLAGGTKTDDVILGVPEAQRQALVRRIQTDGDLKNAVADLNAAKLSVGRRIVGPDLQASHPLLGKLLSGGLDATADWFGDPLVIGAKIAKGAETTRFLIEGPADVRRLAAQSPRVARALEDVSETLNAGGAASLMQRWPKLAPVAEQLVKEGVDSPEKLTDWFAGQAGLSAMLKGRAGGTLAAGQQMIHLSPVDQAALQLKGGLTTAINWAADPARIARQVGDDEGVTLLEQARTRLSRKAEAVKQFTTLTAKGVSFDPSTPNAITTVQRLANYVLPSDRVADIVNTWSAAETIAEKRGIYKGLLGEMFDAAGVTSSKEGRDWAAKFTSQLDDAVTKPVYSGSGADQVVRNGVDARVGLDAPHFTTEWAMPSYRDLTKQANKVSTLSRVYSGTVNADGVDAFMNNVWKPTTLLRLGFPIRAGGEELVAAIMREGALGLVRGRAATSASKAEVLGDADRILPFHPLSRVWNHYAEGLPEQVRGLLETPADFAGAVFGDRARRAFRGVEGKLAGQEYMNAARELWHAGPLQEAFTHEIAATESRAAGYLDDTASVVKVAKEGGTARPAYFSPTGNFREYSPQDDLYVHQWKKGLDELGNGPLFRSALAGVGGDREAQVQGVIGTLESDGYAKMRDFADRSRFTRDGRMVGELGSTRPVPFTEAEVGIAARNLGVTEDEVRAAQSLTHDELAAKFTASADQRDALNKAGAAVGDPAYVRVNGEASLYHGLLSRITPPEATAADANRDWAEAVVDHVNSLVHNDQGEMIPDLAAKVLADRVGPSVAELSDVPLAARPGPVKGREMVQVSRNWVRDVMDRGFEQVVGRPMDWMVRQPLFVHNYAVSLKEAEAVRPLLTAGEHADDLVRQVALERSIAKTVPFIHDAQMRSQFAVVTRNLAPFWFAQEQFYKRWVNIAKHSPEAFREAQLVMMGFRHAGVIHTDQDGNDYFLYPGASVVQNAISKGVEQFTGHKVSLPLPVGFSGQVRFATPGLERLGVPSFGPLVGIPTHYMAERFPELAPIEAGVLGDRGAGRSYWEQVTPTTVARLVHIAIDTPDTSPQMASAMMQAMSYLEAKGFAPADNASPVEREAYNDRVKQWTRILFLTRTLYGFSVPASPELQLDPDHLHEEYRTLLGELPIEQATGEFMARHPDATPYTVFQSKSASGASLPATEQAAKFMSDNEAFLATYPQASGWLIPQESGDEKFSLPAYREQMALQMRQRKSPEEFYRDLKYAEAADGYYRSRDRKNVMLEGVNGPTAAKLRVSNPDLLNQIVAEGAGAKASGSRAQSINGAWATWKDDFLKAHPVFAEELQSPDAQIRRGQALDQLHQALSDPRLPSSSPQLDGVRTLVSGFDEVQAAVRRLSGLTSTTAANQRKAIKGAFVTWAEQYVAEHPEVKGMYQKLIAPEVGA